MDADSAFEQLAEVIQAIQESERLQQWFSVLLSLPEGERSESIQRMAREMSSQGEPEQLVAALWLLANAKVCEAVRLALREEGLET